MFRLYKTIAGILFIRDLEPGLISMFSTRPSVLETGKKTLGTNALDVQEFNLLINVANTQPRKRA